MDTGFELFGARFTAAFLGRKVAQQLADRGIGRAPCRGLVKALGRVGAYLLEPERTRQPQPFAREKALDVLAPDQRDVLAELLAVEVVRSRPWRRCLPLLSRRGRVGPLFSSVSPPRSAPAS